MMQEDTIFLNSTWFIFKNVMKDIPGSAEIFMAE